MASRGLAHANDDGLALFGKAYAHQVSLVVASVDRAAQHTLESLGAKLLDGYFAAFLLKASLGLAVEPLGGAWATARRDLTEERIHGVVRSGRWLPRAPEAQQNSQRPGPRAPGQVPEQDGANSSSSAAEMNSSLHQNDASECPLRTHWSWSWQSHVNCWLPPGHPAPQLP